MGKNLFISNSKKAPKACLIACVLIILTLAGAGYYLIAADALPAPMFTGRISFDEKMRFIRHSNLDDVELVTMGSSIAFNNLSSKVMRSVPGIGEKYFNFAAWGLGMDDLLVYWKFLSKFHDPKIMIICSTPNAFTLGPNLVLNETDLEHYLAKKPSLPYYMKYRNLSFINRIFKIKHLRETNEDYGSLNFDANGGVLLDISDEQIIKKRWETKVRVSYLDHNYDVLDRMLKMLKNDGILVVYVVSPMRSSYLDVDNDAALVEKHWGRVASIVRKHGMHFINMHKTLSLPDRFFADGTHLKSKGAFVFTEKLVEQMEKEGVFQKVNGDIAYGEQIP